MIASVRGTVWPRRPRTVPCSRSAASGWRCPARRAHWPGCVSARPARLATSLVVREDSLTLYGFADDDERASFELLQTANGVGPKLAQTMLAVHPPRAAPGHRHRRPGRPDRGSRASAARAQSASCWSCATASAGRSTAPDQAVARLTAVAPWRDQLAPRLVGLGFGRRRRASDRGGRPELTAADGDAVRCGGAAAPRCGCWAGRDERHRPACAVERSTTGGPARTTGSSRRCRRPTSATRGRAAAQAAGEFVGQPKVREQLRWCSRARCGATGHRITCCCPARPGWARRASP